MKKQNCWEFKKSAYCSDCPVKKEHIANGLNGGINGGRICWVIMDNHDEQEARRQCFQCEFRYKVILEEGLLSSCHETGVYLDRHNNKDSSIPHKCLA